MLAAIPLLFGIQQILEGLQWVALNDQQVSTIALYGFLFFATIVWPTYVPLTVFLLDKKRWGITRWFLAMGSALSLYDAWILLTKPETAQITNHSIQYLCTVANTAPYNWPSWLYLLATCGSFLVSSIPMFRLLGMVGLLSVLITYFFFSVTFVSVWCFFAAVLSSLIYFYVRSRDKAAQVI
jgi:hypothetical protein